MRNRAVGSSCSNVISAAAGSKPRLQRAEGGPLGSCRAPISAPETASQSTFKVWVSRGRAGFDVNQTDHCGEAPTLDRKRRLHLRAVPATGAPLQGLTATGNYPATARTTVGHIGLSESLSQNEQAVAPVAVQLSALRPCWGRTLSKNGVPVPQINHRTSRLHSDSGVESLRCLLVATLAQQHKGLHEDRKRGSTSEACLYG